MTLNEKKRNNYLISLADKAICETRALFVQEGSNSISSSYDGQIAAFSVGIAMSGLKPTLAIYYQDSNTRSVCRKNILQVLVYMLEHDEAFRINGRQVMYEGADKVSSFFREVVRMNDYSALRNEIIECAVALKQVVRTYNMQ